MPDLPVKDPKHWRERAEEVRSAVEQATSEQARNQSRAKQPLSAAVIAATRYIMGKRR